MSEEIGRQPDTLEIAARLAIGEVHAQHSRGLDRLDSGLIAACYWPEAEVDYGSYKGPAATFAELVVPVLGEQYALTRHCLSNTLVRLHGDTALTETCVYATHLLPQRDREVLVYGRYLDRLERRDDCWKMTFRQVVIDWSRRVDVDESEDSEGFADMAKGSHTRDDPLYALLGGTS